MLKFNIKNQIIERLDDFRVVADSKNYLTAEFTLSEEWNNKRVFASFSHMNLNIAKEAEIKNGQCLVPWEVIKPPFFSVSLFCGDLITSNVVSVMVESSGLQNGEPAGTPTPTLWDVYMRQIQAYANQLVGAKTEDGGIIFGDLEGNRALAPFTTSFGTGTIAGVKGYYYSFVEFGEALETSGRYGPCRITLVKEQGAQYSGAFEVGYEVGDVICMVNNSKYPDCATITAIDGNTITVDSLPFDAIEDMTGNLAMDDYSIYVPTKPLAGVAPLGYYAMAVGEDVWVMERASGGIGRNIRIYGQYSFGAGRDITISGYLGFGFGRKLEIGSTCAGFGYNNKIKGGEGSFGSGKNGVIDANAAHGEGKNYDVTGEAAHAQNLYAKAYARGCHVGGYYGTVHEGADFATHIGYRNEVLPTGKHAFIGGKDSETAGEGSFVHGLYLKCNENGIYQWIGGKYNIEDTEGKYALIIGGGTSDKDRRNILTVDWDGNLELAESRAVTEADMSALIGVYTAKELVAGITAEVGVRLLYDEDIDTFSVVVDETVVIDKTSVNEKARIASELLKAEKTRFIFYSGEDVVYTAKVKSTGKNRGMLFEE